MRSPKEMQLNSIGMLYAAIILGWSINYLVFLEEEERLQDPFFISWLTIDCIILMVQLVYSYVQKIALMNGEIIKNVYTMMTVQENAIKKNSMINKIKSLTMVNKLAIPPSQPTRKMTAPLVTSETTSPMYGSLKLQEESNHELSDDTESDY